MTRLLNLAGEAIIKDSESLRLTAYLCPAGQPTIGWGHTAGVKMGDVITPTQAQMFFSDDLSWCEDCVSDACKVAPTDNQFAAMVSLTFNIGAAGFQSSSVLRLHNAGKPDEAASAFALWNKAVVDGQLVVMPGLVVRRAREAALYMTPDAVAPVARAAPMPQVVEPPKSLVTSKSVVAGVVGTAGGVLAVADQVSPTVQAIQNASAAAAATATSLGGLKAAFGSLIDGRALAIVPAALVVACIVYMVARYIKKARSGEVVVS